MPAPPDETARAALLGKRIALVLVIALSVVFVVSSSWQIVPAVFGVMVDPIPAAPAGSPARTCAVGVLHLKQALDRAGDAAGSAAFEPRLQPEWSERPAIEKACAQSSEGLSAWAALARLRSAEEQLAPRTGELANLRRDVIAHLPADLR